jgi:tetraacyldisaccharide 4'-kinase
MNEEETKDVELILLDDAYQHRYVSPGRNILLTDYHRLITQDMMLPAGRLRESAQGKERANMIIVTKCPVNMSPMEYRIIAEALQLRPYQQLYFSRFKYGKMVNMHSFEMKSISEMKHNNVLLATGIGCPQQMRIDIRKRFAGLKYIDFNDHHDYNQKDIETIIREFNDIPEPKIIVTTEKDATKLISLPNLPEEVAKNMWILPIGITFMQDKELTFNEKILSYVQKNKRNRRMA